MTKGTAVLRVRNEKRILTYLRQHETTSRQEMADTLNLSKNTISIIVDKLLKEGMVAELGIDQGSLGRPRIELALVAEACQSIGVLIRETHCEIVVADYLGNVIESDIAYVDTANIAECINELAERCVSLLNKHTKVLGVGVAIPGLVDPTNGMVHYSTHLGWRDVPFVEILQERLGDVPVLVLNRVKAAALSPVKVVPDDADSTFYIRIDEGVGGAYVMGNDILHGTSWTAGEIGHLVVDPDGPLCTCGQRGCLESLISVPSVRRRLQTKIPDMTIDIDNAVTPTIAASVDVEFSFERGAAFNEVMAEIGAYLGTAMAVIINLFNPQFIVIDSPYNKLQPFRDGAVQTANEKALAYPLQSARFEFVNSVLSSALGVAVAVILQFENTL